MLSILWQAIRFVRARRRALTKVPRCIASFRVKPAKLEGFPFDGHGEPDNAVYSVKCQCGGASLKALGHKFDHTDEILASPISLQCRKCERAQVVFDIDQHGYNAEVVYGGKSDVGERLPALEWQCKKCGNGCFEMFTRFEVTSEVCADSTAEFAGKEQDLFSWFTLAGRCSKCGALGTIADYECA